MLAGVSLLLRLQYRELKWRSTYSARIFYERFFTEFEWILDEANLRMKADENLEFRLYR